MTFVLSNIKTLLTMNGDIDAPLGAIHNAAVVVANGKVVWFGKERSLPFVSDEKYDCLGGVVAPGFIDSHTHTVFAGERSHEFYLRSKGASYLEILKAGGGILSTVKHTRDAGFDELVELAEGRLLHMLALGVTTVEIKTGYGLCLEDELKMLDVIDALNKKGPVEIVATFLAAHAVPPEYEGRSDEYIDHIIQDMLPQVKAHGVARACDIFVEKGAFTVEQAKRLLLASKKYGLQVKVHAEQLSHFGGASLASEMSAISASHLEYVNEDDLQHLKGRNVIAEILPIAQDYLGLKQTVQADKFRKAGVTMSVATDFNPGSAMCNSIQLAARLSVTRCGFNCDEALMGITKNAAKALGRDDLGMIKEDLPADLCVLQMETPWEILYDWSKNPVLAVFKKGEKVYESNSGSFASKPLNL